ncbi:helix-turn-helix domain-containing protein [Thalassotalea marina]|uniref:HTH cro/C1-type domain-containing protein n=1 Tax=Thalassotalea marina TaxID=1673741 RepID=A0A919EJU8_9GAMM|nr:helix-turn-helix domain-containing protein [Thalassotalea marina]GHF89904.1 hypothetical protein GCM10017161_17340 [Thalassotalea marina]
MKLGEKIKQLRQQADLTQPELAQKAGIEQSYLSKLENDKAAPSFDVISKVAQALNTDAMSIIESLDNGYLQEHLSHLPEVAVNVASKQREQLERMRKGYIAGAFAIVIGIALVILGNSHGIFSEMVYQYESRGLIKPSEVNAHFSTGTVTEYQENADQRHERIRANKPRLDEQLLMVTTYRGEGFVEYYGQDRRYFKLVDQRTQESGMKSLCIVFGFIFLTSGGFYLGYVFRFLAPRT